MEDNVFIELIKNSKSKSDVCKAVGFPLNGWGLKRVSLRILKLEIDISHFDKTGKEKRRKWPLLTRECPICEEKFVTNEQENKICCSVSCSNKHQPRGSSIDISQYRTVCFKVHKKECIICGENKIVAVHHYDENHDNNAPENLIPLCPTHHTYVHSEYKNEVFPKIEEFRNNFLHLGKK